MVMKHELGCKEAETRNGLLKNGRGDKNRSVKGMTL